MNQTNKIKSIVVAALLVINLAATSVIAVHLIKPADNQGNQSNSDSVLGFETVQNGEYILFIGTNDKDTYTQLIPTDQARDIVNNICIKYVSGYTEVDAHGGWVDETGTLTQENTLIYIITGAAESDIISIMDEVLVALNQDSILVVRQDITSVFYSGNNSAA